MSIQETTRVTLMDRPCGSGKTSSLIESFSNDQQVLVVTPLLSEVERIIECSKVDFYQPLSKDDAGGAHENKQEHLKELLEEGRNIATTHKLYTEIALLAKEGLLSEYDVYIDEVLSVANTVTHEVKRPRKGQVNTTAWSQVYIDKGFCTVDPETKAVIPTEDWDVDPEGLSGTLSYALYRMAKDGSLFALGDKALVWELPPVLMSAPRSLTVLTYLAEGSLMAAYLRKKGVQYHHDTDPALDQSFRKKAKRLITVKDIPALKHVNLSYSAQTKERRVSAADKKVSQTLRSLRERAFPSVPKDHIMITCAKARWYKGGKGPKDTHKPVSGSFSNKSNLVGTHWVPNTTRGTNDFSHCSTLIYLWCQSMNPVIAEFLEVNDKHHRELHAVSELIQWVYRSRVRNGLPITLYLPSARMRKLLQRWMDGDL